MQRLENRLLKLRKAEARANPIEQLQNDCMRRELRLASFRHALVESARRSNRSRRWSSSAATSTRPGARPAGQRSLQRLTQFHEVNLQRLDEAHAALEAFRQQVQQKLFEWQISLAIQDVQEALNPGAADLMQDLLTDEALRSVQSRFNAVFAELDIEMRALDAPTRELLADNAARRHGSAAPARPPTRHGSPS